MKTEQLLKTNTKPLSNKDIADTYKKKFGKTPSFNSHSFGKDSIVAIRNSKLTD